jgi:site-specific recombinase XerD
MKLGRGCQRFMKDYFAGRRLARRTVIAYGLDIAQFKAYAGVGLDLSFIDHHFVERWVDSLRAENYSPASVRRKVAALRVFMSFWVGRGTLEQSPFWRADLKLRRSPPPPRSPLLKDLRKMLASARLAYAACARRRCDRTGYAAGGCLSLIYRAHRDLALLELICATGMRVGEVSALDVVDFDFENMIFKVGGRGRKKRHVFIPSKQVGRVLDAYRERRIGLTRGRGALFLNAQGGRLTEQGISNVIQGLVRRAQVRRHITPGSLRRAVEHRLLERRVDVRVVFHQLGKRHLATGTVVGRLLPAHILGELSKVNQSVRL